MQNQRLPRHFNYIIPVLEVLKEIGGSGRAAEVSDLVIEKLEIPEEVVSETISSGQSKVRNDIQWARQMLVYAGYLDSSQRGVWTLNAKGMEADLSEDDLPDLYELRKKLGKKFREQRKQQAEVEITPLEGEDDSDEPLPTDEDYRTALLDQLKELSPSGFERICQRVLRASGFERVNVTGRSSDGGIDGDGILQVNPFVSFNVLFQCKRYQGSVGAPVVRDFRGAMMGRADKGIIMTTGTFTMEAKREARRDGVTPIELVDGDKLVEMFEKYEIGLKPVKTYELDYKFFEEFKG